MVPAPARGPRARSSLAEVARAGVALADRVGLEGLTLAAIASELGLTTTALYRYVDAKETLVEVMVDEAVGLPPAPPEPGTPWADDVRVWASALLDVYLAHPWLSDVKPTGPPRCPNGMAWYERILPTLDEAPFADATNVILQLNVLIRGYAALTHSVQTDVVPPAWFGAVMAERYPRLVAEAQRPRGGIVDELWIAIDRLLAAPA
ncbi:MAG TPA: TetR/AcrR family transcriptional regulator [Iamia sp.]